MFRILCGIFCLVSSLSFANEYSVALLNIESITVGQWSVSEINDKGQILGSYNNEKINKIYILDLKTGLTFIESKGENLKPLKINNAGQVLGFDNNRRPFIWSKVLGVRWLEIPNAIYPTVAIDLNDLGQIIGHTRLVGSDSENPFIWDYGVVTNMGPNSEFSKTIEALGYHVMSIKLYSINNKGELAGIFSYGKFNEKTKKYINAGSKTFIWDGDVNIIPLPNDFYTSSMKINNRGAALIYGSDTYIWDTENGLRLIYDFIGVDINDSATVLGFQISSSKDYDNPEVAIWKNDYLYTLADLLGVSSLTELAPYLSNSYDIEKIGFNHYYRINNKGQIPCTGWIWGDSYPCLLEPIKKQEELNKDLNSFMDSYNKSNEYDKGSTLRYAIRHDLNDISAYLISYGANSYPDKDKCLFLAAEKGNVEAINQMIENGWNTNIKIEHDNRNLLQYSARMGQPEVCQLFIDLGQNPNEKDKWGYSSLHLATELAINSQSVQEKKTL